MFSFRRFNDFEAANVGNALTPRLAAALYNIQPSNLCLTTLEGNRAVLGAYKSKYTPHSMRVSLITAYVLEMGMPIEIVMKIVGHSSVIMSIYYCKVSNHDIRTRLEEGEKIALKSEVESIQRTIEQNKIESVKTNWLAIIWNYCKLCLMRFLQVILFLEIMVFALLPLQDVRMAVS